MPRIKVNDITMNYDQQGAGEPLILIPYLTADYACRGVSEFENYLCAPSAFSATLRWICPVQESSPQSRRER